MIAKKYFIIYGYVFNIIPHSAADCLFNFFNF